MCAKKAFRRIKSLNLIEDNHWSNLEATGEEATTACTRKLLV